MNTATDWSAEIAKAAGDPVALMRVCIRMLPLVEERQRLEEKLEDRRAADRDRKRRQRNLVESGGEG